MYECTYQALNEACNLCHERFPDTHTRASVIFTIFTPLMVSNRQTGNSQSGKRCTVPKKEKASKSID